ncbi:MAG: class I SAM-dependent methyltransferase [Magnetococcales bacterium]|nr:class I SAM-dependent methyltransferase [Magnetococcales bacterium]
MKRIPEPELMEDDAQALAYARADFSQPHDHFISLFSERFPNHSTGQALDLGCGPCDVLLRFARAFPACRIDGVDGSAAMLAQGSEALANAADVADRIQLFQRLLPGDDLPCPSYDTLLSNSLLHHLHNPHVLWQSVKQHARTGTALFIMDLMRPNSPQRAQEMVDSHAAKEAEILKKDFFHSLCAAFTVEEIQEQLHEAGLAYLTIEAVSDRHLIVYGTIQSPATPQDHL